jgi:hypothetical protein
MQATNQRPFLRARIASCNAWLVSYFIFPQSLITSIDIKFRAFFLPNEESGEIVEEGFMVVGGNIPPFASIICCFSSCVNSLFSALAFSVAFSNNFVALPSAAYLAYIAVK